MASRIPWLGGAVLLVSSHCLPCTYVSVCNVPFYKDTSHAALGPTLMISFELDYLYEDLFPNKATFLAIGGFNISFSGGQIQPIPEPLKSIELQSKREKGCLSKDVLSRELRTRCEEGREPWARSGGWRESR